MTRQRGTARPRLLRRIATVGMLRAAGSLEVANLFLELSSQKLLALAGDVGAAYVWHNTGFDNVFVQSVKAINLGDAFHLGQHSIQQPKVTTRCQSRCSSRLSTTDKPCAFSL